MNGSRGYHQVEVWALYLYNKQSLLLIFVISLVLCLIGSGSYPIYILDEAKNSEAAREMFINKEFVVPTFNTWLRTDKPPLHYYFMMLGYKIFGINALGARFFSGVFGALTIGISFYFTTKFLGKTLGWILVMILWSSIFFIQEFHLAVPDPYLIFFISLGVWCFYDFYKNKNNSSLWVMYIAFAFGMLTKGPVAIALPGLICLLFLISTKTLTIKNIAKYKPFLGLLLVLCIAFPWYYMVHVKTAGDWTRGFFLDHNLNRFGSKMEGHGGIFLITWAFVILGLMPFSFFVASGFIKEFKNKKKDSLTRFCLIVSLVFIVFFSISRTKLPNYTMPCYPFLAVLIAKALWEYAKSRSRSIHSTVVMILITLVAVALPIVGKFALMNEEGLEGSSGVASWLLPTSIITCIGTIFYFKNKPKKAFLTISLGWMLLTPILFLIIYPVLTAQSPVESAKVIIGDKKQPIVAYKKFDAAFPINFQQTFTVLQTEEEITAFFTEFPTGYLITKENNITILTDRKDLEMIFEGKALFESHRTKVFKKRVLP